jgi:tRNA pseudouridine 55 synthase
MINGILPINKPEGWTSFDVVAKIRGMARALTGEKKIKVGHSGTLDPMATGVLPVFIGKATKTIDLLKSHDKEYVASFKLGMKTDTLDITGEVLSQQECEISKEQLLATLSSFTGETEQLPPMYSAVKIDGKRLYDLARQGKEVKREPRKAMIYEIELLEYDGKDSGTLRVFCGKGTYIRTLIDDIGTSLALCGGVMTSLIRTKANGIGISECHEIADISVEQFPELLNAENYI